MKVENVYYLAIDQGTLSTRAILYDENGRSVFSSKQAIEIHRLDDGRVEQDAEKILISIHAVINDVLHETRINRRQIKSAGLATQRSSIVAWQPSTGQAISPVISWQDTRASDWLQQFNNKQKLIRAITGLRLSAHYGVSKMQWLMKNNKAVTDALKTNDCMITPLASYILFNLTEEKFKTIDISNASRTLLCNYLEGNWDERLITLFGINQKILPECRPIQDNYGTLKGTNVRVTAVNGDQTAVLYSNGEPDEKVIRVNIGTGAFVIAPIHKSVLESERFQKSKFLAGVSNSNSIKASYFMEGTVNGAGAAIDWFEHRLRQKNLMSILSNNIKPSANGLFINTVGGLGSPIWKSDIRPHFANDDALEKNPQQALVAIIESIVFLIQINIEQLRSINENFNRIAISGGLSNSEYICQSLANLTSLPVEKFAITEATSRGMAWLSMQNKKKWKKLQPVKIYQSVSDERLQSRYQSFKDYLTDNYQIKNIQ